MSRNGFNNTHVGTQVHYWMILRWFLRAGEVASDDYKDTSFYYCIKVLVLNLHFRFQAILMLFLMLLHTGSLGFASSEHNQPLPQNIWDERADPKRNAQLLSCSVASLCCFHTAKWCLSGLSALQAEHRIAAIFFSLIFHCHCLLSNISFIT